ncbi:MAG: hypothetical protein V1844_25400 [Pseudomonadota bacterium]
MISIRIIMNVLHEKQKEVFQTLLSFIEQPAKEKGCLCYGIFSDIEDFSNIGVPGCFRTADLYLAHE